MWKKGAKGNCAAHDVGSTHLVVADVARLYGEHVENTRKRIDAGREKIAAWLSLIQIVDDYNTPGCSRCGAPKCSDYEKCAARREKIAALADELPLAQLIVMTPSKWYAALVVQRGGSLAFDISVD